MIENLDRKRLVLVIDTAAAGMKSYGKFPIERFLGLAHYLQAHYRFEACVNRVAIYRRKD